MHLDTVGSCELLQRRKPHINAFPDLDKLIILVADSRELAALLLGEGMALAQFPQPCD